MPGGNVRGESPEAADEKAPPRATAWPTWPDSRPLRETPFEPLPAASLATQSDRTDCATTPNRLGAPLASHSRLNPPPALSLISGPLLAHLPATTRGPPATSYRHSSTAGVTNRKRHVIPVAIKTRLRRCWVFSPMCDRGDKHEPPQLLRCPPRKRGRSIPIIRASAIRITRERRKQARQLMSHARKACANG